MTSGIWLRVKDWPRLNDVVMGVKVLHLSLASSILVTGTRCQNLKNYKIKIYIHTHIYR